MQDAKQREGNLTVASGNVVEPSLPQAVALHGAQGKFAWEEYFSAHIRNAHTRAAYLRAVKAFLAWIEPIEPRLASITPGMVGHYFDQLDALSAPSKKLHMSAIRGFFNVLVTRHLILLNPALSVRTERFSVLEGKTPEISVDQARKLLRSIDVTDPVSARDKAIIGVLIYTAARAGAVAKLKFRDLIDDGLQFSIRFNEKGGKHRNIPVRHDLHGLLRDYIQRASLQEQAKDSPLFRSAVGRSGRLSDKKLSAVDICRIVKRRLKTAELPLAVSPHSFRSCAATDLLLQGVALEDVQYLLGHSDARVTRLYDRRQRVVTRNTVERISV
jgi:integrase/recombinase XerD